MSEALLNNSEKMVQRNEKGQLLPGSVLNPDGKPIGTKHLSTQLKEMLFEKAEGSEHTHASLLNKRVLKKAIVDGDMRAVELVYDRVEGKPQQDMEIEHKFDFTDMIRNKKLE